MNPSSFQLMPDAASTAASQVDALYGFLWLVSLFFVVLILALVVTFGIKYRRRNNVPPPEVREAKGIEYFTLFAMFVITMVIFFWGAKVYFFIYRPPADALEIHVIGKQWMWKTQHKNGRREINTLHVPRNTPVMLTIASQDVIHSFYMPAFRIKMDAVPGRYTKTWFEATEVGEYHLFCAEYCGTDHSRMIWKIIVMDPEHYQEWLAGTVDDPVPAQAGAELFDALGCIKCHGVQAPTMAGLFGSTRKFTDGTTAVADEQYLRDSILDSTTKIVEGYPPIMPSYRALVTEEQLIQLIAYIKSLQNPQEPGAAPRPAINQPR